MRKGILNKTGLKINEAYIAEPLEIKLRKAMDSTEKIEMGSPITFTEKKYGALPEYDIRTDRFEIAMEAMNKVNKMEVAKREELAKLEVKGTHDEAKAVNNAEQS